MKYTFLLLGAFVLAAATLKVGAYNLALSPRATENQIKITKRVPAAEVIIANTTQAASSVHINLSPCAKENQIKIAAGSGSADRRAFTSCKFIGSPKAIEQAGRNARMACCGQTLANCSMVATCDK